MYIPAIRVKTSLKKNGGNFQLLPLSSDRNIKEMVLIEFRHVSYLKKFRWHKEWFTKTNWKGATDKDLHECEIESTELVGVFLKDLNKTARDWIVK